MMETEAKDMWTTDRVSRDMKRSRLRQQSGFWHQQLDRPLEGHTGHQTILSIVFIHLVQFSSDELQIK